MATRTSGLRRTLGWMGLWAFTSALLLNSGYYMWWGGFSMGARLTLPMMAAVPFGLIEVCRRERSPHWWRAFVIAGVIAIALTMPIALMDPQLPQIEDTADLLKVTLSSTLRTPQFAYLGTYYSGDWFWGPDATNPVFRVLPLLALTLAGAVLFQTARRLPRESNPSNF